MISNLKQPCEFNALQINQSLKGQVKMVNFIDFLYKKYKVLKRLSEQQSSQFQNQLILLLTDQNQNVDTKVYNQTILKIGVQNFILQILSIVLKRNTLQNHYELNKNLNTITKDIQAKQLQLQKRKKQIDFKEQLFKKKEQNFKKLITNFANQQQHKFLQKITLSQNQMKKRLNELINTLKNKEKLIIEKHKQFKESLKKISQLEQKQKDLNSKLKSLQLKERQKKIKENQISQLNKKITDYNTQMNIYQAKIINLEEEIIKLKKKQKTHELAYKHLKEQNTKNNINKKFQQTIQELKTKLNQAYKEIIHLKIEKEQYQKVKFKIQSKNHFQNMLNLSQLQLSQIDFKPNEENNNQFLSDRFQHDQILLDLKIYSEQQNQQLTKCNRNYNPSKSATTFKQINLIQQNEDWQQEQGKNQNYLSMKILNNNQSKNSLNLQMSQLIKRYSNCSFLLIEKDLIINMIARINQSSDKQTSIKLFYDILLIALEPCCCINHKKSLLQLCLSQLTDFVQIIYLKFEANNNQIQTNSIIILSRILLSVQKQLTESKNYQLNLQKQKMKIKKDFQKGIKIRHLVQKDQFLKANMLYILNYDT